MGAENSQICRLIRWNRFWLILVSLYALIGGSNYAVQRMIAHASRLELNWGEREYSNGEPALVFSSSLGGPFIVTHLVVSPDGNPDTAIDAIAELPHPLFVRGPKARTYLSFRQLSHLRWVEASGEKVAPPKAHTPIKALYYETQKVMTTD